MGTKTGRARAGPLVRGEIMELYYKDLISKEASLDKLVDDLMLMVQGVDQFAQTAAASLSESEKQEITSRLEQLKAACLRLREHAVAGALAADKTVLLASWCLCRKRK